MRKISYLLIAVTVCLSLCNVVKELDPMFVKFEMFREKFNKTYESLDELSQRFEIFKKNVESLNITGNESSNPDETHYGITQFMDLTPEEFKGNFTTLNMTHFPSNATAFFANSTNNSSLRFLQSEEKLPESFDWRDHGVLTHVKFQGGCGGCWAFSALTSLESAIFRKFGYLPVLSVQQLVDCDSGNWGCSGGIIHNAYQYIREWGVEEAVTYPYKYAQGSCRYNSLRAKFSMNNFVYLGDDDEEKMKNMLVKYGPLAITINANLLQYYTGGVINVDYDYCPYAPSHGVVIVGYGTTSGGLDYWIVRNSWGLSWGEDGYFRIARGRGLCGLNKYVTAALLD
jgi:cathepsin F